MPIDKIEEFAKNGQKSTEGIILENGFPQEEKPARQWFNYILNSQAVKTNEVIDEANRLTEEQSGVVSDIEDLSEQLNIQGLDTGITATAKFGGVARSQADVNSDTINAAQFGLISGSTADQTTALQDFINYLALNGGYGEVTQSTYNFSDSLVLPPDYTSKGFTIDFKDSTLKLTSTANEAPISFIAPKNVILKNGTVDGGYSRTGNENHGIAFSNPIASVCEKMHVVDYRMSAILFFVNSAGMAATNNNTDNTYRDCHIRNCTSDGNGAGRNGMLLVDLYTSTIDGCNAKGLDRTSAPSIGLQLKNQCRKSMILNSTAEDCIEGVAIGGDGVGAGAAGTGCLVSNVTVINSVNGVITSKSTDCTFKNIVIDMVGNPDNLVGVNIAGNNTGILVEATVLNIPSTSKAIVMRSSYSQVDLKLPTGLNVAATYFAQIGLGVQYSDITVSQMRKGEASTNLLSMIEDLSGTTTNTFTYPLAQNTGGLTDTSYQYFNTKTGGLSSISYSGSLKTYSYRANGVALCFMRENSFSPSSDGVMSLGGNGRRFSQLYATTATINVSDERLKTKIKKSNAAEKRAAEKIKSVIGKYQFKDAVSKKGDKARYHYGVGAQTVEKILREEGLEPFSYAFLCYDKWDADGDLPAGEGYAIRYEELIMFILAAI